MIYSSSLVIFYERGFSIMFDVFPRKRGNNGVFQEISVHFYRRRTNDSFCV